MLILLLRRWLFRRWRRRFAVASGISPERGPLIIIGIGRRSAVVALIFRYAITTSERREIRIFNGTLVLQF